MRNTMIDHGRQLRASFLLPVFFVAMIFFVAASLFAGGQIPVAPSVELQGESAARVTLPEAIPKTSVCKSELLRHVSTLASDEFQGRDPAGEGGLMAAKYLAAEFERLGLKPGGDGGEYFQNFTGSGAKSVFRSRGKHTLSKEKTPKKGALARKSAPKVATLVEGTHATEAESHTDSGNEESVGNRSGEEKKSGEKDGKEGEGDGDAPDPPISDEEMEAAARKICDWLNKKFDKTPRKTECREFSCRNVLGLLPGSDPELKDEVIIVSAHYDHLGVHRGKVYNGADDNASGTASLLELARVLANRKKRLRRTILFAAWDGEEKGLLGSSHWTRAPTVPIDRVVAVINLDMIGRLRHDKLIVLGAGSSDPLSEIVRVCAKRAKLKLLEWEIGGSSDHWSFYLVGVPGVTFCTGVHRDYHAPTDDVRRVRFDGLERIAGMVLGLVGELANRDARVEFTCDP